MLENLLARTTILAVDDDETQTFLIGRQLQKAGCKQVLVTSKPHQAITLFAEHSPDLVLVDLRMPGMDGIELMRQLKQYQKEGDFVPIIVLTGDMSKEAKMMALQAGATDLIDKMTEDFELVLRVTNHIRTRFLYLQNQQHSKELEERVFERTVELERAQLDVLRRLAAAGEYRDDNTGKHVVRVGRIAEQLALAVGLTPQFAQALRLASKLHDVGKIGVSDTILNKKGPLSSEERAMMQMHTLIGSRILENGSSYYLQLAEEVARTHHEWWDGSGYPMCLRGEQIPISGRIVAIADTYDALITVRPYKAAIPIPEAKEIIRAESGSHFDPSLVRAFLKLDIRTDFSPAFSELTA